MDPQLTWEDMLDALAAYDFTTASEAAESLMEWLRRGGFPPQPLTRVLSDDWDREICQFVCERIQREIQNEENNQ